MNYSVEANLNKKVENGLKKLPDETLYKMARITLDMSINHIPKSSVVSHAGTLRKASMQNGVRGSNGDYYLTSSTNYATRVWNFNDASTNWTTPGTHSEWWDWTLKSYGKQIQDNAINQSWKETM